MPLSYVANPEYHALLYREVQIRRKIREAKRELGLEYYTPHEFQEAFHRAGHKKARLAEAGNRSGKSEMGAAEDASWLRGERPFFAKSDPDRYKGIPQGRPVKGVVVTTDWDKAAEIFTSETSGKLWRYLPRGFARASRNRQGYIDKIVCQNGSELHFDTMKSYDNNKLSAESSQWDFAHFDEPLKKDHYTAIARGFMDTDGSEWFTLTPLEHPWIHYKFFDTRSNDNTQERTKESEFNWAVRFSVYDNPHISPDAIRRFEADLTPDEREARLYGVPLALSGVVYKEFQHHQHVLQELPPGWQGWNLPPKDWTIWYTIDPHPRTPHAVLFNAVSPEGYYYMYDEIFRHCGIQQLCNEIAVKIYDRYIGGAFIDPIAFNKDTEHRTMADDFMKEGFYLGVAPKALEHGIIQVKKRLIERDIRGNPTIRFSPNLSRTLKEFDLYCWDKETNKPKDEHDHMMENLYRQILINPRHISKTDREDMNTPIDELEITGADLSMSNSEIWG